MRVQLGERERDYLRLCLAKKVDTHGPERVLVLGSHIGGVHLVENQ